MATVDFAAISGALATWLENQVANQINRSVVLAQLLDVYPGTGKNVTWDVRTGTATPATAVIGDGADVTTFNNDAKQPATLNFGTYHDAFSITGKAMAAARAAGNPAELSMLFMDELGDAVERLARAVAEDSYSGDGSANTIHGLHGSPVAALGDTGVYAGIDRAVVTQWQGNVVDATATPNFDTDAFPLLRQLRRVVYQASGERLDLIIMDPVQHEKLGLAYQAERRYVDQIRIRGQEIKLDGGYMVLEFDGVPCIEDVQHPAQIVTGLNTRHVRLAQLSDAPDAMNRAMGRVGLAGTPEEQYGAGRTKLTARIQPLAITGDAFKFSLYVYPQLQVKRPNACGFIENLSA